MAGVDEKIILMADDDEDDRLMVSEALKDTGMSDFTLRFVTDGEELLDYLGHRGKYADPVAASRPAIILLDLNMPRKDGREVLWEIKCDPELRRIPVIVLTTSRAREDIRRAYDYGGNSFIVKPDSFDELVEIMRTVVSYWLNTVELSAW